MRIYSIFRSIDGEVNYWGQGTMCTFIRFAGCNLNCHWCFGVRPGRRIPRIIISQGENKKLPDIEVGDKLLTFDENGGLVETQVVGTVQREVDSWVEIKVEGRQYFVTPEHPIFTSRGLIEVGELKPGDEILHSSYNDKLSFRMRGEKNPMKDPEVSQRKVVNTDYHLVGKKISVARKGKTFGPMSEETKKKISFTKLGSKNPNWQGGKDRNCKKLKKLCSQGKLKCSLCPTLARDVHHKDKNMENDDWGNLQPLCHSCHSSIHQIGYNFWVEERKDGKKLAVKNGLLVSEVKMINRFDKPPSIRPNPLLVYNLTCFPYNTYLVDYMWVHNCDTEYARDPDSGVEMSIDLILSEVKRLGCGKITITGGEPYEQIEGLEELVNQLYHADYGVSIETNGTHRPIWRSDNPSHVVDYKLPSSGMSDHMKGENFHVLGPYDFVKFVIRDRKDFAIATHTKVTLKHKGCMARFAFSPVDGEITPQLLLEWMDKEELCNSILNIQLHKLLELKEDA